MDSKYTDKINEYIRHSRLQSNYLICGFIKTIEIRNYLIIPTCVVDLCQTFHFIDITRTVFDVEFTPTNWYNITRRVLDARDYLLGISLATFFVDHFESKDDEVRRMYLSLFYNIVALTYEDLKLPHKSEIYYRLSIETDAKTDVWLWNYSELLTQQCRYNEARDLLEKAVKLRPNRLLYLYALAQILENINEIALSLEQHKKIISKDNAVPDNGKNYLFKAVAFKKLDIMQESQMEYEKYAKLVNKNQVHGNTRYAILLFALEKYDEALQYLNTAVECGKDTAFTYYYMGLIMKHKHKYIAAKNSFEKAIDLCPIYPCCKREIDAL